MVVATGINMTCIIYYDFILIKSASFFVSYDGMYRNFFGVMEYVTRWYRVWLLLWLLEMDIGYVYMAIFTCGSSILGGWCIGHGFWHWGKQGG